MESTGNIACGQLRTLSIGDAITVIDAADYHRVEAFEWRPFRLRNHTYARAWRGQKQFLMHRVILGLDHGDPRVADHIDGDGLNNCRVNLRVCSNAENLWNRRRTSNRSGYKGVFERRGRYIVTIGGDHQYLGYFESAHAAALAYNAAARQRYGEFAALNDVNLDAYRAELREQIAVAAEHVASLEKTLAEISQW